MAVAISGTASATGDTSLNQAVFSGLSIGTAAADRWVVAAVTLHDIVSISSVTVGGVTATQVVLQSGTSGGVVALYAALVPTGTTANVVVTTGADTTVGVSLFRVVGASVSGGSATFPTTQASNGTGTSISISPTIPTDGGFIAGFWNETSSAVTWTNATEAFDFQTSTFVDRHSSAFRTTAGAVTVTADGATDDQAIVGATIAVPGSGAAAKTKYYKQRRAA